MASEFETRPGGTFAAAVLFATLIHQLSRQGILDADGYLKRLEAVAHEYDKLDDDGDNSEFLMRVALILRDLLGKPKPPPPPIAEGETLDWLEKLIGKAGGTGITGTDQ